MSSRANHNLRGKCMAATHDGHVTLLLGAACHLSKRDDFDGNAHLIFQPAEEGNGADARTMN